MGQTWCLARGIMRHSSKTGFHRHNLPNATHTHLLYTVITWYAWVVITKYFLKHSKNWFVLDRPFFEDSQIVPCFPLSRRVTAQIIFRIRRKVGSPTWNMKLFHQPTRAVITWPNSHKFPVAKDMFQQTNQKTTERLIILNNSDT